MNTENLAERVLRAVVSGLVVGIIVAILVWLVVELTTFVADPGFWGTIAGVITALYVFLTRKTVNL